MGFTRTSVVRSELFYRKSKILNGLLVVLRLRLYMKALI